MGGRRAHGRGSVTASRRATTRNEAVAALAVVALAGAALAWVGYVNSLVTWQIDGVDQLTSASVLILSSLIVVGLSVVFGATPNYFWVLLLGLFGCSVVLRLSPGSIQPRRVPGPALILLLGTDLFALVVRTLSLDAGGDASNSRDLPGARVLARGGRRGTGTSALECTAGLRWSGLRIHLGTERLAGMAWCA